MALQGESVKGRRSLRRLAASWYWRIDVSPSKYQSNRRIPFSGSSAPSFAAAMNPSSDMPNAAITFAIRLHLPSCGDRGRRAALSQDRVDLARGLRQALLSSHRHELFHRLDGRELALDRHPGLPAAD